MSNSVLDNLAESDQSETDSFKGDKPVGKKIHLRDVLAAVAVESPVKTPPAENEEDPTDPPSRKRRIVSIKISVLLFKHSRITEKQ